MTAPLCAVGAIVMDKGRLLMVLRDREPLKGCWTLPGGRLETGESMHEAIVREVREETGIDIDVDGLLGVVERIVRNDDGEVSYHYVILDFVATPRGTAIKAGDDAAEVRWVPVGELSSLKLTDGLIEFLSDRGILEGRKPRL
ncbi:MAG TPA: NUDIX hydrolase [Actinomycetota bacterium]|nr:NUDIX hydrolase [Actinomycetota bacterium]